MSGQPIFSDLSGNPVDARVRYYGQPKITTITGGGPQVPFAATASFIQAQVHGGGPALQRNEIVDTILQPKGAPLDGLPGKFQPGGGPLACGSLDPRNPLQLALHAMVPGYYTFTTPVGTGTGYLVNLLAGYAVGDTAIAVDTGAGTVLPGDVVQFTGDTHKYVVASSTGGGTVTLVTLEAPGLRQTLADDVAMTIATYNVLRCGLSETTAVKDWLTVQWNDQVVTPRNYAGFLPTGFNMGATANNPQLVEFPYAYHYFSQFGDVTQVAGSGSTLPVLFGTMDETYDAEATDSDLYVMVVSASAKTFKVKRGLGSGVSVGYGGANTLLTAVPGTALRIVDQYGEKIGNPDDQVQLFVAASPTWTDADVFKILRRRAPWTENLPARAPVSSVNTQFIVDGEAITIPGGVQEATQWDGVYDALDTPGSQGKIVENSGSLISTVTPNRRITDRLFQTKMRVGGYVFVVVDSISSTQIGNTQRYYRCLRIYPRCLVTGTLFVTVPGGTSKEEVPVLVAKKPLTAQSYGGYTNLVDPCTVIWETSLSLAQIGSIAA